MIPRYHGRWEIAIDGAPRRVTIQWNRDRLSYFITSQSDGMTVSCGRNGIRRWLKKHEARPVDGQEALA